MARRALAGGGGRRTLFPGVCRECTRSTGTARGPGERSGAGGYPGSPAMESRTAQPCVLRSVPARGLSPGGDAEDVPGISLPRTSVLHPAEEAPWRMQIGRHEFFRLSSTPLAQTKYSKSLILLLAHLWTSSWWSMFPNLEQSLSCSLSLLSWSQQSHPAHHIWCIWSL